MGVTRLFVTTDSSKADQTAGFWQNHPDGYTVHKIGPTQAVKVQKAEEPNTLWQTQGATPWYGILVTKVDAAAAAGGAAAGGGGADGGGADAGGAGTGGTGAGTGTGGGGADD